VASCALRSFLGAARLWVKRASLGHVTVPKWVVGMALYPGIPDLPGGVLVLVIA
jgi:hypothetical protein